MQTASVLESDDVFLVMNEDKAYLWQGKVSLTAVMDVYVHKEFSTSTCVEYVDGV